MEKRNSHLFGIASSGDLNVTDPSTGEVVAVVALSSEEHVDTALQKASHLFEDRSRWLSLAERIAILERLAELMEPQVEKLASDIAREGGKPLMDARVEANRAIQGVKKCIEAVSSEAGDVVPMGMYANSAKRIAFTQKEPIGVVLAISAFNHPLNLIVHQVGASIAAGCPCIVKPAHDTPLSCLNFFDLLIEAGLPESYLQVIITDQLDLASKLVKSERIAFLSFIGSAKVGWMLRQQVQPGVRCALEHGGVAPMIVTKSADLEAAVAAVAKGGFYHAGQVCVSTQRVFVEKSHLDTFMELLSAKVEQLKVGDAKAPDTEVGPLIREAEVDRVESWVDEAVAGGAELIMGGKRIDNRFYQPTILLSPPEDSKISRMEVFGPVVAIYPFSVLDRAITQANSLDVAFQAALFSEELSECLYIYKRLHASAVMVNDHTAFREDGMPFAGLKQSGLAVGGIHHTIRDMQIDKMMVIQSEQLA